MRMRQHIYLIVWLWLHYGVCQELQGQCCSAASMLQLMLQTSALQALLEARALQATS